MLLKKLLVPFVLLILGIVVTVAGAIFKIQHWSNGRLLLTIGTFIEFCAIFYGIIILIKSSRKK